MTPNSLTIPVVSVSFNYNWISIVQKLWMSITTSIKWLYVFQLIISILVIKISLVAQYYYRDITEHCTQHGFPVTWPWTNLIKNWIIIDQEMTGYAQHFTKVLLFYQIAFNQNRLCSKVKKKPRWYLRIPIPPEISG